MNAEQKIVEILEFVVSGVTVNEEIWGWRIHNLNSPHILDMDYGKDAFFGFEVSVGESVNFFNFHREAPKGTGTKLLVQIEAALKILARKIKKRVVISFHTKQQDTNRWLQRNGYVLRDGGYTKII